MRVPARLRQQLPPRLAAAPAGPPAAAPGGGGRGTPPPPCSVSEAQKQERPAEPLWPWWDEAIGGYFKFHWNYPTPITVKIDDPKSPLTAAFRGKSFNTIDEVYTFNESSFSRERVRVLTSVDYSLMSDCDKGHRGRSPQGSRLRAQLDSEGRSGAGLLRSARPPRVDLLQQPGHAGAHPGRYAVRARRPEGGRQPEQEEVRRVRSPQSVVRSPSRPHQRG